MQVRDLETRIRGKFFGDNKRTEVASVGCQRIPHYIYPELGSMDLDCCGPHLSNYSI